jgi:hypothetical protein
VELRHVLLCGALTEGADGCRADRHRAGDVQRTAHPEPRLRFPGLLQPRVCAPGEDRPFCDRLQVGPATPTQGPPLALSMLSVLWPPFPRPWIFVWSMWEGVHAQTVHVWLHSCSLHAIVPSHPGAARRGLGDRPLTVTYAEPKNAPPLASEVKSIYVGNLPASATEAVLKGLFEDLGEARVCFRRLILMCCAQRFGGPGHARQTLCF